MDGSMMITARNLPTISNTVTTPASSSNVVVAETDILEIVAAASAVLPLTDTPSAAKRRSLTVGLSPQRRHRDIFARNIITAEN